MKEDYCKLILIFLMVGVLFGECRKVGKRSRQEAVPTEENMESIKICREIFHQCMKASENIDDDDQVEKARDFCYHLAEQEDDCFEDVRQNVECYRSCSNQCGNKTDDGKVWLACIMSCGKCNPNYKDNTVDPQKVCKAVDDQCKALIDRIADEDAKKNLEKECHKLEKRMGECVKEVNTNPVCFSLCIASCSNDVEEGNLEGWKDCSYGSVSYTHLTLPTIYSV
eukprot:TRINITY_DN5106_c0_g1_i6.p1 TRINITY_DN5106_c0_g1~~TRINITY_DN5106_c0_g1_i6.p1  ORF type:complete len:225 (-),score=35.82 TRINITY_DN5106_c0_g1_i6:34-708(-)